MPWVGLKKELDRAAKNRNVQIKTIEIESGKTRGHFHKVISGERKPGKEMIESLAKSLEISEDYIVAQIEKTYTSKEEKIPPAPLREEALPPVKKKLIQYSLKNKLVVIALLTSILLIGYFSLKHSSERSNDSRVNGPRIPGDKARFIKDVTVIDHSYVLANQAYKKVWKVKNAGTIPWNNRFLKMIPSHSEGGCSSEGMVRVQDTLPNEEVCIEAYIKTPEMSGGGTSCAT